MLCGIKLQCASQQRPGCLQTGAVSYSRHQRSAKIVHMIKVLPDTKQDGIFQKFGAFCGHAALVGMLLCCGTCLNNKIFFCPDFLWLSNHLCH